ncbi:GGDEF domain-containing protein [Shewanella litorisediminis]|uniref:diguanylate cyclase n=1 Tax=Shewanella litorisediminis TaxID=1173586 RepID=A0ABX7G6D8_9GAMM|nr:GGDEF domain-containing protein [Shewanella litorisediminis]MCL2916939.1 GGDEF domain-containing protein [Shewanella litorisediminis]QRH02899.1 GGDEF domain-containing protein [Shewanella litorisediminis]
MDFGIAAQIYPDDYHFGLKASVADIHDGPDQLALVTIVQQLHASLDPRTVFACFGKVLGQYLPLVGVQAQFAEIQLSWGKRVGVSLKRHLNAEACRGAVLDYRLDTPLTPAQIRILQTLESMLIQPLLNAIQYQKMSEQAMFDPLTGLGNRNFYGQAIKHAVARAGRHQDKLSLIILDLDNFKQLNDTHGHQFGDAVLRQFGALVKSAIRNTDQAFRIGGDEFVVLVRGELDSATLLCERILSKLAKGSFFCRNRIHTSLGAAEIQAGENQDNLYERADKALYQAKAAGRNCYRLSLQHPVKS